MSENQDLNKQESIISNLMKVGFVFEIARIKDIKISIKKSIAPHIEIDLYPLLTKVYRHCEKDENSQAAKLISELTSLLLAAELGLAPEYLIELEVKRSMPRILNRLRRDLRDAV